MKTLIYATGAFLSPDKLYWEDKGGPTINLFLSLCLPPANYCISILEEKCFCPWHPLSPQVFLQMWYEGVATIQYPETPVAFEWQAQDLDAKSERRLSSRSSWLLGRCIIRAALKLPMGLSHVLATRRLPWLLCPLEMLFSIKYYLFFWNFLCFA